jgi:general secretion pathway protein E
MGVDAAHPPTLFRSTDNERGYEGRTGIYELVTIDNDMRTMIHDGAGEHELERNARRRGPSIREDGIRRVLAGSTTLEEVLRVTRGD